MRLRAPGADVAIALALLWGLTPHRPAGQRLERTRDDTTAVTSRGLTPEAQTPAAAAIAEARKQLDAGQAAPAIATLEPVVSRLAPESTERREAVQILGQAHYLSGHLVEAIPYLEEARRAQPLDPKLSYALGTAYAQTRAPAKAREAFARVFHLEPESAAAYLLSGQMMNRLELEDLAESELREAIRRDPRLPEAHYLLAQIAIFRSRLDEGLALLRKELAINPAHAMSLYRVGDVYSRQQKWPEAIDALQQSIWMNPYFSGPYILLGKAYSRTGQPGPAEDMLRHAIEYDPNNKSAHYLLGQLLQQTGRPEEAKREFAIAEKLQGDIK
jgi:tetratricopeptide (TPR) repeat protein